MMEASRAIQSSFISGMSEIRSVAEGVSTEPVTSIEATHILSPDEAVRQISTLQLITRGADIRREIDLLNEAGLTTRANEEPDIEREIEFNAPDGQIVVAKLSLRQLDDERKARELKASQNAQSKADAEEDTRVRLDDMGSVPTYQILKRRDQYIQVATSLRGDASIH